MIARTRAVGIVSALSLAVGLGLIACSESVTLEDCERAAEKYASLTVAALNEPDKEGRLQLEAELDQLLKDIEGRCELSIKIQ